MVYITLFTCNGIMFYGGYMSNYNFLSGLTATQVGVGEVGVAYVEGKAFFYL